MPAPRNCFHEDPLKLEIVEHFRKQHGIRGFLDDFTSDETKCTIAIKGPGYSADVFLNRETGEYEVIQRMAGLTAMMNDLHKGRASGKA